MNAQGVAGALVSFTMADRTEDGIVIKIFDTKEKNI
jgi:hypothetical protein